MTIAMRRQPKSRIEDYAMLGDTETAALVGKDGSIDWLCTPRFDSAACFAALLGDEDNGRWQIAPATEILRVERAYRPGTLILETVFHCAEGVVALVDFMVPRDERPNLIRIVEGRSGRVPMVMDLRIRFDYGSIIPWVRQHEGRLLAVAGPDGLCLDTPIPTRGEDHRTVARFTVGLGDSVPFELATFPSHVPPAPAPDVDAALAYTERWWNEWSERHTYDGEWADVVHQSLVVLKGLTYGPTGGIVAAATTSLPEDLGGMRNWDYRYCWLRDATFTLMTLMNAGYVEEASAWREWLMRAAAGEPDKLQIMYGVAGERRLSEYEVPWLAGHEGSTPVRVGNAASQQFQLDVYGEVMDSSHQARVAGLHEGPESWALQTVIMDFLESGWRQPDEGIWEVRGDRQHFTHSKVMAWVAADRAVQAVERFGLDGPLDRWRRLCLDIRADILDHGVNADGVFTQDYGSPTLDASLLMVPLVGFLPPDDERVHRTVEAIERDLTHDGFVLRYRTDHTDDGLSGGEGAFLLCSFWLADCLHMIGRSADARRLYERLVALRNDVGLLSEEYDPGSGRLLGNIPQAFSHVSLVNTAMNLSAEDRSAAALRSRRR